MAKYMVWGKEHTGKKDEPFIKFYSCDSLRDAIRYIKRESRYYDSLRAYRWSSENHNLNYNPNTPERTVDPEYMYPIDSIYAFL